jgi:ferredoxin like protein
MATSTPLSERLGANAFNSDKQPHLRIDEPDLCRGCATKPCIAVCPAQVYLWDGDRLRISWENCLELGACRIACHEIGNRALLWEYPRASRGVSFRYG